MIPEKVPERCLIKLGNPDAVRVRRRAFGNDIHGKFAKAQISPDSCGGGDAGGVKNFADHCFGKVMGGHLIMLQIGGHIHKDFIDGIDMNVHPGQCISDR